MYCQTCETYVLDCTCRDCEFCLRYRRVAARWADTEAITALVYPGGPHFEPGTVFTLEEVDPVGSPAQLTDSPHGGG